MLIPSTASGSASPRSSVLVKVGLAWASVAALVPTVIGIVMVHSPQRVMTPGTTTAQTFATLAFRNFGFSAILVLALVTQPPRVIAFLLAARGLTEWADGLSGVFIAHDAWLMPAIGGLGDLLFAWLLYRSDRGSKG